ncbi:NAD(P)H-dependent oxidoreductase [Apibacter sp. HY039]|uniref:NAD(P)H-dependent oxidoreductase n=1 Tax=Apibacter sp. HY039 TaxID=2501476 RepID=UPI000FEBAAF3|nr:NAD(P)H-dependent oxidoreductase [Apibacter sp. HY039]
MKKILIINGHPSLNSLNSALAESYFKGAKESGADVELINIGELNFNPNLQNGYQKRMDWEPDLQHAWESIEKAEHLVWVHPVWWGGFPAIMKGFIDRVFLPGVAFQYRKNSVWWDKYLKGKTARIITTLDQPQWYYRLFYGNPSINQLKKSILAFCGIKRVKTTFIEFVKKSDLNQRKKWIQKIYTLGIKQK